MYVSKYGSGVFMENVAFNLATKITSKDTVPRPGLDYYYESEGYYWSMFFLPIKKINSMPTVDFQKVFEDRKTVNKFLMTIIVDYTFDNEETRSVELYYEIYANKNSFKTSFMGL